MPDRAKVTSVEAIKDFRTALIIYLSKARPTLEEVGMEVVRTKAWLEREQRVYWENQVRIRTRELERTQQALFAARMSTLTSNMLQTQQMAVRKAQRALEDAQNKLMLVKVWDREYENRVQPLAKQLDKLQTVLSNDLSKAVVYLAEITRTLDEYAQTFGDAAGTSLSSGATPATPSNPESSSSKPPDGDTPKIV